MNVEPTTGLEPVTSSLPRTCSTAELRGPVVVSLKLFSTHRKKPNGAGNGARTRDHQLGRLMLYQLSYSRKKWWREVDLNHRRRTPTGLQPVPFGHSGIPPSFMAFLPSAGHRRGAGDRT